MLLWGRWGVCRRLLQGSAKTLPTSVEDAIDTMRTVEAAYISSERGGVELPGLEWVTPLPPLFCANSSNDWV